MIGLWWLIFWTWIPYRVLKMPVESPINENKAASCRTPCVFSSMWISKEYWTTFRPLMKGLTFCS